MINTIRYDSQDLTIDQLTEPMMKAILRKNGHDPDKLGYTETRETLLNVFYAFQIIKIRQAAKGVSQEVVEYAAELSNVAIRNLFFRLNYSMTLLNYKGRNTPMISKKDDCLVHHFFDHSGCKLKIALIGFWGTIEDNLLKLNMESTIAQFTVAQMMYDEIQGFYRRIRSHISLFAFNHGFEQNEWVLPHCPTYRENEWAAIAKSEYGAPADASKAAAAEPEQKKDDVNAARQRCLQTFEEIRGQLLKVQQHLEDELHPGFN